MRRVRLIHWNAAEAKERARRIEALGFAVDAALPSAKTFRRELRTNPPSAVVIDLSRIPTQGRDVAFAIRHTKATRLLPIVFVGGEPQKVAGIKAQLPDALYASWQGIGGALRRAIARPPADPVVPVSVLAGYSGTPLPRKLGIKESSLVSLLGPPRGFAKTLGPLPAGVRLRREAPDPDLALWFVRSRAVLLDGIARRAAALERGALWIVWPKKTSALASDVSERDVRQAGLAAGLVDYKVCAVDETWSGLKFARRRR